MEVLQRLTVTESGNLPENETDDDVDASVAFNNPFYWVFIDAILFIIIVTGNILTILSIRLSRRLKNVTSNYFILNLAISDLLVGLTMPYHSAFYLIESVGETKGACILRFVLYCLACCASICNVTAIALDRYIAIVHPLKYSKFMTRRTFTCMLFCGWVYAIIVGTMPAYWNCLDTGAECQLDTALPRYYTVAILTPTLCFIWISMSVLYLQIWKEASSQAKRLRETGLESIRKSEWKSVQVVLLILGCFTICWLPYLVVACKLAFDAPKKSSPLVYKATFSLAMANSGMNPLIYAWKNTNFRKAFQKLLHFQSPGYNEFNSSLKNYLRRQQELASMESSSGDNVNVNFHRTIIPTISNTCSLNQKDEVTRV